MIDEEIKLERFKTAVMIEAEGKARDIKEKAENYKEEELSKKEGEHKARIQKAVDDKTSEIEKINLANVSRAKLDAKREVLKKRNEIFDELFGNIVNRLGEFAKTSDYVEYMSKQISKVQAIGTGVLLVRAEDMEILEKMYIASEIEVKQTEDIKLGGFIFRTENRVIDKTIDEMLEEEKVRFMENSKLMV